MAAIHDARGVLGRGVYGASEALQLINLRVVGKVTPAGTTPISRSTVARWLQGYDYRVEDETHHSDPFWTPDYANDDGDQIELSFRDLIEVRFVKAFRDAGVGLPTIRRCFARAVEEVRDERPFSTSRFKTDGRTIFLDITSGETDGALVDLRQRQTVFRSFVAPSFRDLEFDADVVARWYPLGTTRRSILIDPTFAFGRPVSAQGHVPTEVLAMAASVEGSIPAAARAYEVSTQTVRDALEFQLKLAA